MAPHKARMCVKHSLEIVSAGGLAFGARKSAHPNLAAGMVVGYICQTAQRATDIADDDARDINLVIDLGHIGNGARLNRLQQVLALKACTLANKKRSRAAQLGVVGSEFDERIGIEFIGANKDIGTLECFYKHPQGMRGLRGFLHRSALLITAGKSAPYKSNAPAL